MKSFQPSSSFVPITAPSCPADSCLAAHFAQPGGYKAAGDGHLSIIAFKRMEPDFPGVLFEEPVALAQTETDKVAYFRANQRMQRLQGVLYYFVALDTAGSVQGQANRAYEDFLKSMRVD